MGDAQDGGATLTSQENEPAAEWVQVDTLTPWAKNPRKNDHRVQDAVASLRRFGFQAPIVAWGSRKRVVAGHARIKAVRMILADDPGHVFPGAPGPGFGPVRFTEVNSEGEADAYALRDNNPIGEWDPDGVAAVLRDLNAQGVDMAGIGWTDNDIDRLINGAGDGDMDATDAPDQSSKLTDRFEVVVICRNEEEQAALLMRLTDEGFQCRSLIS